MPATDPAFLKKLLETFRVEADEHIALISSGLVALEKASPERRHEVVETIFREAHSLKGAARSVNLGKVEAVCQSLESIFAEMKRDATPLSPQLFDRLHQMVSVAGAEIAGSAAPVPATAPRAAVPKPAQPSESPARRNQPEDRPGLGDTVRISTAKLATILLQVEELNLTRAAAAHHAAQLQELRATMTAWERDCRKVRPTASGPLLTFLDRNERAAQSIGAQFGGLVKSFENDRRALERQAGELLDDVKRLSMLPFAMLLEVFPKLVRDLCRDCGKEAELVVRGGDLEAERRILDEIKDPLIHLVRNAIDHGIESPAERMRAGKPARATITISISPQAGDRVELLLSDDGGGIDAARVLAAAVRQGRLTPAEAQKTDPRQALAFIFQSGLSTRPMITEVSGRGLGLAIVRDKVTRLGGDVTVETERGAGTTFRLILPLLVARFRGVLVRAGEQLFVVPTAHIQRTLRVEHGRIRSVENRPVVELGGQAVSVAWLSEVLGSGARESAVGPSHKWPGLLLEWAAERILFLVDEVLQDQEVLVKNLGKQLLRVRNVSGAAVLQTGKVAPVLDVADLMRSAANTAPAAPAGEPEAKPKSILVAEDSITARTLVKGILESAGYAVTTAVDGFDAFRILENEIFDLVVSDVEMPRMTGFDLTAKIRANRKLSELPVVLVTALDSREDRERGADAGANAYIVKSSFDQSNLLEVVQRLI